MRKYDRGGLNVLEVTGEGRTILLAAAAGCQPAGSKIMMADGTWKNIEELSIGEEVLSPQNNGEYIFSKVISKNSWFCNENYVIKELNRRKKTLYRCSYNHIIPLSRRTTPTTKNTKIYYWGYAEYQASYFSTLSNNTKRRRLIGFTCPPIPCFKGKKNCEIEPYTLGNVIGNGSFLHSYLSITTPFQEIMDKISKYYPVTRIDQGIGCKSYFFSLNGELAFSLKKYGLNNKKSGEKYIPPEALLSDIDYRKKLLAGLIDSDGYYPQKKGYYIYTTKSEQLAKDILSLVYSLGGRANITKTKKQIKKLGFIGEYYDVIFYLGNHQLPIQVEKKKRDVKTFYLASNRIAIDAIKSKPEVVYGITIEGPSQLYITDNFMVTHNSGKTVFIQNYAKDFRRKFGKVIYVTEKHISAMENAFMCIDTISSKQKQLLDRISMPESERYPEKIEILHPFTFSFPTQNVPENIKLFTFSIKEVDPSSYAALIGRSPQSPASILCKQVAENLGKQEDLFSFLYKIYERSREKEGEELSIASLRQTMGIPIESYGSKTDVQQITSKFSPLQEHYLLHRESEPLNLNEKRWKEIIQDTETITMFTGWKIPDKDKYIRYFIIIEILQKLKEHLPSYAKGSVLLILEEIMALLPRSVMEGSIEEVLALIIRELLVSIRSSNVTILMTTQGYNQTSPHLRIVADENIILMKQTAEDIKAFARDFRISKHNYDTLVGLKTGEFVFLKDILGENELAPKFHCFYVPFAHREEGYKDFVTEFKKRYPNRLISHKETIKSIRKQYEECFEAHLKNMKEKEKQRREKKKQEKETTTKNLPESTDSVDIDKKCYDFVQQNPDLSWNARTALFDGNISRNHLQKLAVKYALEIQDHDFIDRFSSKAFVRTNFPESTI